VGLLFDLWKVAMSKLLEYAEITVFWILIGGFVAGHAWLLSIGLTAADM
jgi:hypothetical protein